MSWQIKGTTNCCSQYMFCIVVYMFNPYSLCVCYCSCWVCLWTVVLIKQKYHTHVWLLPWHFLKEHPILKKNICPLECKSLPQEFFFYSCFVFGVCACGLPFFI